MSSTPRVIPRQIQTARLHLHHRRTAAAAAVTAASCRFTEGICSGMSLREQVTRHKQHAERRITDALASLSVIDDVDAEDDPAAAGRLGFAGLGIGGHARREWKEGAPPPGWGLADWVAALKIGDTVASVLVERCLMRRGSDAPNEEDGAGEAAAEQRAISAMEVAALGVQDVQAIAEKAGALIKDALEHHVSTLKETTAALQRADDALTPRARARSKVEASLRTPTAGGGGVAKFVLDPLRLQRGGIPDAAAVGSPAAVAGREGGVIEWLRAASGVSGDGLGLERGRTGPRGQGRLQEKDGRLFEAEWSRALEMAWVSRTGMLECGAEELLKGMQREHVAGPDARDAFWLPGQAAVFGGKEKTPAAEWEFVVGSNAVRRARARSHTHTHTHTAHTYEHMTQKGACGRHF